MSSASRSAPMEVKYWTRAGLMLTDWCNAACACCYANCGPAGKTWLDVEAALKIWQGLITASPHGCRIHLTGGEPFGNFELLLQVCRQGRQRGLGPLESIETNGYWAENDDAIRARLHALDQQGMGRLVISADPYHQQYVPIERPQRLARIAREVLGAERLRVRWEDWLAGGRDVSPTPEVQERLFLDAYAAAGRDRLTGRATDHLAGSLPKRPAEAFDGAGCSERLLRGRHVHIAPSGQVWPATCVGIAIGNALSEELPHIWERLSHSWRQMEIVQPLCARGPAGLLERARATGFRPRAEGYASKCQLCFDLRRHLIQSPAAPTAGLGPAGVYALEAPPGGAMSRSQGKS